MNLPRLHCLTYDGGPMNHEEQALAFLQGGSKLIQLRAKNLDIQTVSEIASGLVQSCQKEGAHLVVNDHLEIAQDLKIGLHMGREDGDPVQARRCLGPSALLGQTVNCLDEAKWVRQLNVASYAGVGPWRFTETKAGLAPVLDHASIAEIVQILAPIPVVLIGGITSRDLPAIFQTGAHGCALSSALANQADPAAHTAALLASMKEYI